MEKKTTVHPIFLTLEQLEMVKQLVAPKLEYDYEGDLNIWAEDEEAMNAGQIYRQIEIANKVGLQLAWLTCYDVHHTYGGPEEGGWGYDHWSVRWTEAHDCVEDLVKAFNNQVRELSNEDGLTTKLLDERFISDTWLDAMRHCIDSPFSYLRMERFKVDNQHSIYLVIEVTPGAEATIHQPIWC